MSKQKIACFSGIAALILGFQSLAQATVYNFYINNTEQGDNAKADPSITIQQNPDSKQQSKPQEGNPNQQADLPLRPFAVKDWRFDLLFTTYSQTNPYASKDRDFQCLYTKNGNIKSGCELKNDISGRGVNLGLNYSFNKNLSLEFYLLLSKISSVPRVLRNAGIEFQYTPVHVLIRKLNREIHFGLLGGINTMGFQRPPAARKLDEPGYLGFLDKEGIRVHLGFRVAVAVIPDVDATLGLRRGLGDDAFTQLDVGFAFHY